MQNDNSIWSLDRFFFGKIRIQNSFSHLNIYIMEKSLWFCKEKDFYPVPSFIGHAKIWIRVKNEVMITFFITSYIE